MSEYFSVQTMNQGQQLFAYEQMQKHLQNC